MDALAEYTTEETEAQDTAQAKPDSFLPELVKDTATNGDEVEADDNLVEQAYQWLQERFKTHVATFMIEAGHYIIAEFYGGDYDNAAKKRRVKGRSLLKLIDRLQDGSGDAPPKTWIYDAVNLAVDDHFYGDFEGYGSLGHIQKLRLAYVKNADIKEKLITETAENNYSDNKLRERIAEEKKNLPQRKWTPSPIQAMKSPTLVRNHRIRGKLSFEYLNKLDENQFDEMIENFNAAVRKIKSEIEIKEKELELQNEYLTEYRQISKWLDAIIEWKETQEKRKSGEEALKLPKETPLLKKLRIDVEFMCFWKGWSYSDLIVAAFDNYIPFEELTEHNLKFLLRQGQCDLRPTYNFEVTKKGKFKWLSREQVYKRIEKGKFWMSKEQYEKLSDPKYWDYK